MRAITAAIIWLLSAGAVRAEPIFAMNEEIPPMSARVCFSLAAAVEQARISQLLGRANAYSAKEDEAPQGCAHITTALRPLRVEKRIAEYVGWAPVYDPYGASTSPAERDRILYRVPFKVQKRKMRFYEGVFAFGDDQRHGWIELSDEPYSILFFRERGQR